MLASRMTPRLLFTPTRACSDAHLARRATSGDNDAYAALYARYQPRLESYCRSIVRNDEDARDAVQNAMTKALVALRREGASVANVQAWLFRIAHNEAVSVLRRRRPTSELAEDSGEPGPDPASDLLLREELAAVLVGVRALPGRLQQPLLLRELAGMSYGQVAEVTGGTAAAARKAVFDARLALSADREGRDEACSVIRQSLSEGDHRRRRARIVRSHLRVCGACRDWEHDLSARRRQLAAFLPAGAAGGSLWAWIAGLLGSGSSAAVGVVSNAKIAAAVVAITAGATVPVVAEHEGAGGTSATAAIATAKPGPVAPAAVRRAARRTARAAAVTAATSPSAAAPRAAAPAARARAVTNAAAAKATAAYAGAGAVAQHPATERLAAAPLPDRATPAAAAAGTPQRPSAPARDWGSNTSAFQQPGTAQQPDGRSPSGPQPRPSTAAPGATAQPSAPTTPAPMPDVG